MKKYLLLLLVFSWASVSAFATTYNIGTENALRTLSACASTDTVVLKQDIPMSDANFTPLCLDGFMGIFDGGNHTISNLHITGNVKTMKYIAFIAFLGEGGVLKNLSFDTPVITANEQGNGKVNNASVAVAVGALNGGIVENVHVDGGSILVKEGKNATDIDVGGLAGSANSGSIGASGGNIDVRHDGLGSVVVGGICGKVTGEVTITSVTYNGNAASMIGAGGENVTTATKYGALTVKEKGTTKTAVIDGDYVATDAVEINGVEVSSVTLDRTFNANKISTLYVPFEIAATDVVGAEVYKFKTVVWNEDENRWKFKVTTTETVKPNTPYVVLPKGSEVSFNISGTVILDTETEGEVASNGQWDFVGTYSYISFVQSNTDPIYLFANQERDGAKLGQFVRIGTGAYTNPMRAYLVYHKSAALSKSVHGNLGGSILLPDELDIEIEDEKGVIVETGRINTVTGEVRMDRWFDLKGRRLNSRPSAKGTYYKNGKKAIIK